MFTLDIAMALSNVVKKRVLILSTGLFAVLFSMLTTIPLALYRSLVMSGYLLLLMFALAGAIDLVFARDVRKEAPRFFCKRKDRTPAETQWLKEYLRRQLNSPQTAVTLLLLLLFLLFRMPIALGEINNPSVSLFTAGSSFLFDFCAEGIIGWLGTRKRLASVEEFQFAMQHQTSSTAQSVSI